MSDSLPVAPLLMGLLEQVTVDPYFDKYTHIPIQIGTWAGQTTPREIRRLLKAAEELEELRKLRAQTHGVFAETGSAPLPPGPRLDTPQKRLAEKRRREGR